MVVGVVRVGRQQTKVCRHHRQQGAWVLWHATLWRRSWLALPCGLVSFGTRLAALSRCCQSAARHTRACRCWHRVRHVKRKLGRVRPLPHCTTIQYPRCAVGLLGPSLTALSIALLTRGEDGVPGMVRKASIRHAGWLWLACLLPWLSAAATVGLWLREGGGEEVTWSLGDARRLLAPGASAGVLSAIAEEFGWRGFLFPALCAYFPPLRAALLTGGVAAVWHAAPVFLGVPGVGRAVGSPLLPIPALVAVPWALVAGWLHLRSRGSLLLAAAFNASATAAFVVGHAPLHTGTSEARTYFALWEMVLANVVAAPFYILLARAHSRAGSRGGNGDALAAAFDTPVDEPVAVRGAGTGDDDDRKTR